MSFHIPLHTSTYFHEYHKLVAASKKLPLILTKTLSWFYLLGNWPTAKSHGSGWK